MSQMTLIAIASPTSILLSLGGIWLLWRLAHYALVRSPLDNIPGPNPASWRKGNLHHFSDRHGWRFLDRLDTYNGVARVDGLFGDKLLYIFDPTALQYIIIKDQQSYEPVSWWTTILNFTLGPGLLGTYGDHHRNQRKMLNPVFSSAHMRNITPVFYQVAYKLRDGITTEVKDAPKDVDILSWMGRTALELIGQGGLGYSFDPLTENIPNLYGDALKAYLPTVARLGWLRHLTHHVKFIGRLSCARAIVSYIRIERLQNMVKIVTTLEEMANEILKDKREALAAGDETLMEQIGQGKDIMSILLRANTLAHEDEKLGEDELKGQMRTLLFAATDTTSGALTQILQLLAEHPDVQERLREEIIDAYQDGEVPYDTLIGLPYLDAVCRETLRLYPPVSSVFRQANRNTVLPLSQPIRGNDGTLLSEIPITKGTTTIVAIRACNRNKALWGEDALEWKPERWLSPLPETVTNARIPGVYSNQLSFFGGGRSCIGIQFSQLEMKVVLSVMINTFKFSMPDSKYKITWNLAGVKYPTVEQYGLQPCFPMKIERVRKA
ncbi:cytochrome P450 [Cristinia sonorae]|uniref:Cytochrome P450 n=1 Tax=Cristinia sonorae TaxID=1940300 RepID=A0A8K0URV6_9AGAR|nr:cytochrome P450 [Cristinia sonorae]